MKVLKIFIVLGIIFLLVLIVLVNILQNMDPFGWGKSYAGNSFNPIAWYKLNNRLDFKSYGINKPVSKNALIVDFSDADLKYNDSIFNIMCGTEHYIDDNLKEWKKAHLIYKKNRYKIKYKFHGSHNYNYKQGKASLKIKSKKNINNTKKFSLICGYQEASFVNVFLALQEHKQKLIAPDPGTILLANVNNKVEDFWFTEDLSDDYLEYNYDLKDYKIFEVSDNWTRNSGPHFSELDGFYYYLDGDNLEENSEKYNKYKVFIDNINKNKNGENFPNVDYKYMGRFLANLYYYYGVHHVQGDNNKYLYDFKKDIVYPIARNEGIYEKIGNVLNLDQEIFDTRQSPTTQFYKKAVCNDSIKFYRDLELYKMVKEKDKTLGELDSLCNLYDDFHKYYNVGYMNVRYKYEKMRGVVDHNGKALEKYLNNGEVIIAYDKKNRIMKIASDYRVPLRVTDVKNSESFVFKGVNFEYIKDKIETSLVETEHVFKNVISKDQIKIVNMVTKDTIADSNIIFNYF